MAQYVSVAAILLLLAPASARDYYDRCEGFSVGTKSGLSNMVSNGVAMEPFTVKSAPAHQNTLGSDYQSTYFYFAKFGDPVRATVTLEHTTAFDSSLMGPVASGDLAGKEGSIDRSGSELLVEYNCYSTGGTSTLWLHIHIDAAEADRVCGGGHQDRDIFIMWSKFCLSKLTAQSDLIMGTSPKLADVFTNGQTVPVWQLDPPVKDSEVASVYDDSFNKVVLSSVPESQFYIRTGDGSTQVYGKPRFETDASKIIVILTSGFNGGIANSQPQEIGVEYLCDAGTVAAVEVTMTIDLCAANVPSGECDVDKNLGNEPVVVHWVKNCGLMDYSFWFSDVVVMLVLAGSILCVFGCCFNYSVKHKRGIEVIPGGRLIESALAKLGGSVRPSRRDGYHKQMRVQEVNIRERDSNSISIGETQSSAGVVTVHFDSGSVPSAYQNNDKDDDGEFDEADF